MILWYSLLDVADVLMELSMYLISRTVAETIQLLKDLFDFMFLCTPVTRRWFTLSTLYLHDMYCSLFRPITSRITSVYVDGNLMVNRSRCFFTNGIACLFACSTAHMVDYSCFSAINASNEYRVDVVDYYDESTLQSRIRSHLNNEIEVHTLQWIGCDDKLRPVNYTLCWRSSFMDGEIDDIVGQIMAITTKFRIFSIMTNRLGVLCRSAMETQQTVKDYKVTVDECDTYTDVTILINLSLPPEHRIQKMNMDGLYAHAQHIMVANLWIASSITLIIFCIFLIPTSHYPVQNFSVVEYYKKNRIEW